VLFPTHLPILSPANVTKQLLVSNVYTSASRYIQLKMSPAFLKNDSLVTIPRNAAPSSLSVY